MHITASNGLSGGLPRALRALWTMLVALGPVFRRGLAAPPGGPVPLGSPERLSDRQLKDIGLDRARIFAAFHRRRD